MPRTEWTDLPEGVTLELLDQYARQRENARRRADYAKHPERVEKHRTQTYTNFLNRHGMLVIPFPRAPRPWSDMQKDCFIHMLECAIDEQAGGVKIAECE